MSSPTGARSCSLVGGRSSGEHSSSTGDFATQEARFRNLLGEQHETLFLESSFEVGDASPSATTAATVSGTFLGVAKESKMRVKNLDTGEVRHVLNEASPSFVGVCEEPGRLSSRSGGPWDSWRQEVWQRNSELWEAASREDIQQLEALISSLECDEAHWSLSRRSIASPSASLLSARSSMPLTSSEEPWGAAYAHINSRSLHGRTALHIAAACGRPANVEVLLRARADMEMCTDAGFTALHVACQRGSLDVVQQLHAAGCNLEAETLEGEHALHLSASHGHSEVLHFLLMHCQAEARYLRNRYGQRPAEVCQDIGTLMVFAASVDSASLRSSSSSEGRQTEDTYAGRTPFHGVVLRNSRADSVRRLLQGTVALHHKSIGGPVEASYSSGLIPAASMLQKKHAGAGGGLTCGSAIGGKAPGPADGFPGAGGASGVAAAALGCDRTPKPHRRQMSFSRLREDQIEVVGPDSFALKAVLGKGSFGEVYHVVHRRSGESYAMKVLRKNKIFGRKLVRYAITERNLLSYVRHPFIVRLHYAFQTQTCLVLVLHYCPGGNLSSLISAEGRLAEDLAQLYTAEIFLAIEHLHDRQVVYRDLKPENVVLDEQSHAMLTDFGLSKENVDGLQGTKSFCGSVAYLAPEILARRGHGTPVDLYGLGVLLYECLAGRPPYYSRDRDTLFKNIASATLHIPSGVTVEAASLVQALMHRDPTQRLGAHSTSEVREHPFFHGLDFEQVLQREVPVPPLRRSRRDGSTQAPAPRPQGAQPKVTSPFEGRLEASVRRSLASASSQEVRGWEFAAAMPVSCSGAAGHNSVHSPSLTRDEACGNPSSTATPPNRDVATTSRRRRGGLFCRPSRAKLCLPAAIF